MRERADLIGAQLEVYSRVAAGTDSIDPGRMAFEAAATTSSPLAREVSRIMAVRHRDAPGEVIVRFPSSFNSRCYSSLTMPKPDSRFLMRI